VDENLIRGSSLRKVDISILFVPHKLPKIALLRRSWSEIERFPSNLFGNYYVASFSIVKIRNGHRRLRCRFL
jgi:hypothetical protein